MKFRLARGKIGLKILMFLTGRMMQCEPEEQKSLGGFRYSYVIIRPPGEAW